MTSNTPLSPTTASRRAWLAALLLQRQNRLMSRFFTAYARLSGVGRRTRRWLRRQAAAAAVGAALILGLAGGAFIAPTAHAATITVDGVNCTLVDAIRAANTNAIVGGCNAGAPIGSDTIQLHADTTLTASYGYYYESDTGLPLITEDLIIAGNGHAITRDTTDPDEFRIMATAEHVDLTLNDVTISGGISKEDGGGLFFDYGTATIIASTFTGNEADEKGGGIYHDNGSMTLTDSVISGNSAEDGGGIYNDADTLIIERSIFADNESYDDGGAIFNDGWLTVTDSTFTGNEATGNDGDGGAIQVHDEGAVNILNSTFSGNSAADDGGAISFESIFANPGSSTITHATITGNTAQHRGGGIYVYGGFVSDTPKASLVRSIVSGNSAALGYEIDSDGGGLTGDADNIFSDDSKSTADAFGTFAPGTSDSDFSYDAGDLALSAILDSTAADNGGPNAGVANDPILTHALVSGSPAIDKATTGADYDQRGFLRPHGAAYDAGAVEYGSAPPPAVYMSAKTAGTTDDDVDFDNSDILKWDGTNWSKVFDGTNAHLDPVNKPKHNVNAFFYEDDEIIMSFAQNGRKVGDLPDKVDGMDLVRWDGSSFVLWFDGSDVGLTKKTPEKIDALHLMPGDAAPLEFGGACEQYLFISTQGAGAVPAYGGGQIKFSGEDVLGFCLTNWGDATAGFWHMVLDGSAVGLPKNSLDSISAGADGSVIYFTTSKPVVLGTPPNTVSGGHSMVFAYDTTTGEFSGPLFIAANHGLGQMVDGLDVVGGLE